MSFKNSKDAIEGTLKDLGAIKIVFLYPSNMNCIVMYYEYRNEKCSFCIQNIELKQSEESIVVMIRKRFEYTTNTKYNNADVVLNAGEQNGRSV